MPFLLSLNLLFFVIIIGVKKVIVGLSGGVDSAVAAYLLIQQGYEVVGAFMRNWDSNLNNDFLGNPHNFDEQCPQEVDYWDAKGVADKLGIPLLRVDFIKEYWDDVFTYFIKEYQEGRTPNPDVLCNKYIKFKAFLDFALKEGADYIATGHYAGIEEIEGVYHLLKAKDLNKDQSYFLALLNQFQLSKTIFPLSKIEKPEVRRIAKELKLDIATKKDSTGICFIGERNFRSFLKNYIPAQPGNIIDIKSNKVVGSHSGVMYYTLGQRKGMSIGGIKDFELGSWFVVGKDIVKRELYVSQDVNDKLLFADKVIVKDFSLIFGKPFYEFKDLKCKYRYRQSDIKVQVKFIDETTLLILNKEKAKATTIGQICVLYENDICLGGGIISELLWN
jgi:tRNA-specific 2-thiouridylase